MASWIDTIFGGGRAAAGQAMTDELQQGLAGGQGLYNQGFGYLNPFVSREAGQYQQYLNAINQAQDPTKLYNQFASSYQMSPQAQAQIQLGQKAASNAAAASGMLGSGASEIQAANIAQSVRASDFDKYMANQFGLRNQYLSGLKGLQGQGFQASLAGANLSAQEAEMQQKYYEDMANAKAAEQMGQAGGWENALGAGLGIASDIWGGGTIGGLAKNIWNNI